jgi:NAD-dependent dihydropyrimidine dehydrogenase PreA subunit
MNSVVKTAISIVSTIGIVVLLSAMSAKMQGHKEESSKSVSIIITDSMTIEQFGDINKIPNQKLKELFGLKNQNDLVKKISQTGLSKEQVTQQFTKQKTIAIEYESRNWIKIPLKFALTVTLLFVVFSFIRKGKVTPTFRLVLLPISILIFGIVFGPDPNPMGTVKDAIVLFGKKHIIFPPRMVAFVIFLLMVIIANKFICSWACQFGTLQEFLFRLGRKGEKSIIPQFKIPFILSNTIRVLFFVTFTVIAFFLTFDIIGLIDPFKIFNPLKLGLIGAIFTGAILIASLFIYRPWCHFFCPFGLVGWLAERISIFKIRVNYTTCIACGKCEAACPSTVMGAILKCNKTIPDCFSCGTCISVCPTKSITFGKGNRDKPPRDKFSNLQNETKN